jgi:hypothetical protein
MQAMPMDRSQLVQTNLQTKGLSGNNVVLNDRAKRARQRIRPLGCCCGVAAFTLTVACSNSMSGVTLPSGGVPPGWQTYSDETYRFAVGYPADLGILPETNVLSAGAVTRVRFQDARLFSTPFAELEPPRFTVEVFRIAAATSLKNWLTSGGRLPADATTTSVALGGAQEGMRVQLRQQLAPNEFYYFATTQFVYAVTPLASAAPDMLASFRLF